MKRRFALIWAFLGILYVAIATPYLVKGLPAGWFTRPAAFHSTDIYLKSCVDLSNGSTRLIAWFHSLPEGPIILYYIEDDTQSSIVSMIIRYLGWPRHFEAIALDRPSSQSIRPRHPAAIIFCAISPPSSIHPDFIFSPRLTALTPH